MIALWWLGCTTEVPVADGEWSPGVPGYPGARPLCETERPVGERTLRIVAFATPARPARVRAFYLHHLARAPAENAGRTVFTVGEHTYLTVGPPTAPDYTCGTAPGPADRTALVVASFTP